MLLLLTAFAVYVAWVSANTALIKNDTRVCTGLKEAGVEITEVVPARNFMENLIGQQLQPSRFKVKLRHDQNRYLYQLTQLSNVEDLAISLEGNLTNLMQFSQLENLKRLSITEWYRPTSMDGVQSLKKLEYLEIGNVERPEKIDLTSLANHPSLMEFSIDGWSLDKSKKFQVLPDW